jgi:hypothetical protein
MLNIESQSKIIDEEYPELDTSIINNNDRLIRKEFHRIKTKSSDIDYKFDDDEDIRKFDAPCPLAQQGIAGIYLYYYIFILLILF